MNKNFLSGAFFFVFMALSLPMILVSLRPVFSRMEIPSVLSVVQGKWAAEFEKNLGKSLPVYDPSRNLWGRIEYRLFHQGRKGVLIGSDGWLFTDEEFSCPPQASRNLHDNLSYIAGVQKTLAEKDVRLAVVLVPAKARLFSGHMGVHRMPACRKSVYNDTINLLKNNNIIAADLLATMNAFPVKETLYLRTDTHWSPSGARLAAAAVRELVRSRLSALKLQSDRFSIRAGETKDYRGDLMSYVPGVDDGELPPDRFPVFTAELSTVTANAGSSLFDDSGVPPVTLVGTSYSANPTWNFSGFLKEALHSDILNMADEGQGPFTVMDKYLKDDLWKKSPPRLLIWEIPERYILMPHGQI